MRLFRSVLIALAVVSVTSLGGAKLQASLVYFADFENNLNDTSGFGTALDMDGVGNLSYSSNTPLGSGSSLLFGAPKSFGWASPGANTKLELSTFTIEAWVNLASVNTASPGLTTIFAYQPSGSDEDGRGFQLVLTSEQKIDILIGTSAADNFFEHIVGSTAVPLDEWHHIAATYTATTGDTKVYLDGVLDGSDTVGTLVYSDIAGLGPNPKTAYLGIAHNATNTGPLSDAQLVRPYTENSLIDRFRIHNGILDAQELDFFTETNAAVPEPSSIALLVMGSMALLVFGRRRRCDG